jgi:hypothetical protein
MSKFYVVTDKALIEKLNDFNKDRDAALKARHDFAKKHFPDFHEIHHYEGSRWGVTYRPDERGFTKIPAYMRDDRKLGMCVPLKKSPKGKKIAEAMDELPALKGGGTACEIMDIQRFQFIGSGLVSLSPGLSLIKQGPHKGKYLLSIHDDVAFKEKGCKRISDLEAEKIKKAKKS